MTEREHRVIEGTSSSPTGRGSRIVASRFNHFIVDRLVEGALDALVRHGGELANVTVVRVPGRVGDAARRAADSRRLGEASTRSIALGAVIRGATPHFDYVAGEAPKGLAAVAIQTGVIRRASASSRPTPSSRRSSAPGTKAGNKGWDAAVSADRDGVARAARSRADPARVAIATQGLTWAHDTPAARRRCRCSSRSRHRASTRRRGHRALLAQLRGRSRGARLRRRGRARRRRARCAELDAQDQRRRRRTGASSGWRASTATCCASAPGSSCTAHDVPRAVILDEAVELAKAFGTDESSAFVNGVLNRSPTRSGGRTSRRGRELSAMELRFLAPEPPRARRAPAAKLMRLLHLERRAPDARLRGAARLAAGGAGEPSGEGELSEGEAAKCCSCRAGRACRSTRCSCSGWGRARSSTRPRSGRRSSLSSSRSRGCACGARSSSCRGARETRSRPNAPRSSCSKRRATRRRTTPGGSSRGPRRRRRFEPRAAKGAGSGRT